MRLKCLASRWQRAIAIVAMIGAVLVACAAPALADTSVSSLSTTTWSASTGTVPASTTTAPPVEQPIYECDGTLAAHAVLQHEEGDAYAQCTIQLDKITYQWTWTDEVTGAVLYSESGAQYNTTDLSTSAAVYTGTVGHRTIQICFQTYLGGYVMNGGSPCTKVFHQ